MAQILLFEEGCLSVEHLTDGTRRPTTWTEFKFALRSHYSPLGQRKAAHSKLAEFRRTKSVYEYVSALEVLMAVADDVTNGRRRHFLCGLKPAILTQLQLQGSHETLSYHDLVEKAKEINFRLFGCEEEGVKNRPQGSADDSSSRGVLAQGQNSSPRSYNIPISEELRSHPVLLAQPQVWLPVVNGLVRCAYYEGPKQRGWLSLFRPRRPLHVKTMLVGRANDWYRVELM